MTDLLVSNWQVRLSASSSALPGRKLWLLLCLCISCLFVKQVNAQCASATVPTNFSTWNWEEQPYADPTNPSAGFRQAYCNTWQANIGTPSQVSGFPMRSPWQKPGSVGLQAISLTGDYKKADGWELIRFDFGGQGSVPVPYFLLYNKRTGILRIFAYVVNPNPLTGVVFTLIHSGNNNISGHTAATRGLSRTLIQAPDKYLSQPNTASDNVEQTSYVAFYAGNSSWTMGQFTMLLDPNINDPAYNLNSYQFLISGMIESTVLLEGTFQYKTGQYASSDFSFSGSESVPKPISGGTDPSIKQIVATGQKYLGDVSSIATKIAGINESASKLASKITATTGPAADVKRQSENIRNQTAGGALQSLGQVANTLGGVFGLAGTIIGFFSDDGSAKPAFIPTYAKGSINMSGSIKTKAMLHSFFTLTSATSHSPKGSTPSTGASAPIPADAATQLAYYNCPQGIFNIRNTPALQKIDYQRVVTENVPYTYQPGQGSEFTQPEYLKPFTSYSFLNGDIKPIVNSESGLEITSVKIAVAQKVLLKDVTLPYTDQTISANYTSVIRTYNFLYSQISKGALEVYPYDEGKASDGSDAQVIVQTPFIEAACLTNGITPLPFNIPTPGADRPVYLRLIAQLHKIGTPSDSAPLYFAQDYAIDIVPSTATYNTQQHILTPPPFDSYYVGGYTSPANMYVYDLVKTGTQTYDTNRPNEFANQTLLFDQGSAVTANASAYGSAIAFRASQSVGFTGTLTVAPGTEFSVTTSLESVLTDNSARSQCNMAVPAYSQTQNLPCYYDSRALRTGNVLATSQASSLQAQVLTLSPNPATGSVLAQLKVDDCIQQIDLLSVAGRALWQKSFNCTHSLQETIPLSELPTGIYIVRVTTSNKVYTSKIAVE